MATLTVGTLIGAGAYGQVYHARWGKRRVAIKRFKVTQAEVGQDGVIQREVYLLERLRDRHIVQFYGTAYHEGMLVLVMEYADGGSLQGAIKKRLLDWPTKERIAQEIMRGLEYIHQENVLHRDLKSGNVLLTRGMEAKLCDFGMATVKVTSASRSSGSLKGTFRWMAPELLTSNPRYSTKSDIYALGMVMWEMAANCTIPFKNQLDNFVVMSLVKSGERERVPQYTPSKYRAWIERCWETDPKMRPEASEMIEDEDDEVPTMPPEVSSPESTVSVTASSPIVHHRKSLVQQSPPAAQRKMIIGQITTRRAANESLNERRRRERADISRLDTVRIDEGELWYFTSAKWLIEWHLFIAGESPPGPIDNSQFLQDNGQPRPAMKRGKHYRCVNRRVWEYFHAIYGGGPQFTRAILDVYAPAPVDQVHG